MRIEFYNSHFLVNRMWNSCSSMWNVGLGDIKLAFCDYCLKVTCDYCNIATIH